MVVGVVDVGRQDGDTHRLCLSDEPADLGDVVAVTGHEGGEPLFGVVRFEVGGLRFGGAPRLFVGHAKVYVQSGAQGIQLESAAVERNGILQPYLRLALDPDPAQDHGVSRRQLQSSGNGILRALPVPIVSKLDPAEGGMPLGQIRFEGQRSFHRRPGLRVTLADRYQATVRLPRVGHLRAAQPSANSPSDSRASL